MTREEKDDLRERLQRRLDAEGGPTKTAAAKEIGISRTQLYTVLRGDADSYDSTWEAVRAWLDGEGSEPHRSSADLSRQIDQVLASGADELTKTARIVDLWGAHRLQAVQRLGEILDADRELLRLRAQAVQDVTHAARVEADTAARRQIEASIVPADLSIEDAGEFRELALTILGKPPEERKRLLRDLGT